MNRFRVGIGAASRHLANLDLPDEDDRLAVLREHVRRRASG
jgi:hypothetical protein